MMETVGDGVQVNKQNAKNPLKKATTTEHFRSITVLPFKLPPDDCQLKVFLTEILTSSITVKRNDTHKSWQISLNWNVIKSEKNAQFLLFEASVNKRTSTAKV